MKLLKKMVIILPFIITGWSLFLHWDIDSTNRFVTSQKCESCHEKHYKSWRDNTLHPWQFRPIDKPRNAILPLVPSGAGRTFSEDEVEFVVGNKWENIFIRKIDGEYYPFTAKWLINKQKWVPYKVNSWKKVPMSKKCNGCHTTGFNPDTLEFAEFGIGCESCHGPGGTHLQNQSKRINPECVICHRDDPGYKPDIIVTVSGTVCGQCHNRGKNKATGKHEAGKFSFPINYPLDGNLDKYYKQLTLEDDKKQKYWWENGIAKNRHQEFAEWKNSAHANALKFMKEKHTKERGKLTDDCLKCHSTDYERAKPGKKPDLKSAKYGITCVSCHNPHGFDKNNPKGGQRQCGGCHVDSMSSKSSLKKSRHYPCPLSNVKCADCHMPYTVISGEEYSLRSHAFQIVTPIQTKKIGIPNSCQNGTCHIDKSLEWAIREYETFYPDQKKQPHTP